MQLAVSVQPGAEIPSFLYEIFAGATVSNQVPPSGPDVLVRWGTTEGSTRIPLVYNRRRALENTLNHDRRREMLESSGINYRPELRRTKRRGFRVDLFDLVPLAVVGPSATQERPQLIRTDSRLYKKLFNLAIRTLYGLGLDFGRVEIRIPPGQRPAVVDVDPTPAPFADTLDKWKKVVEKSVHDFYSNRVPDSLGADPEFLFVHSATGRIIPASNFLPARGSVGCDARVTNLGGRSRPLAELRPSPASSPGELVRRLKFLLKRVRRMIPDPNVEWRAGCMPVPGYPIGGHVHFGGIRPSLRLLRALDTYVGLLMMLLENPIAGSQRRNKYGFLGDYRTQPHGFEYRTPGSWLISPRIAKATLSLAWVVARNYRVLDRDVFLEPDSIRDFYSGTKTSFLEMAAHLWADLEAIPDYRSYEEDILILKELIFNKKRWKEKTDIKKTWITKPLRRT